MHRSSVSRRRFLSLSGLAAAGGLLARNPFARACPELEDIGPAAALANGMNRFAVDLYSRLAKDEPGNVFVSPFSISAALAMTSAGATGETLTEMQRVLRLPEEPHVAFRDLLEYVNGPKFELFRPDPAVSGPVPKESPLPPFKRKYELSSANALWGMKGYPWRKAFLELTKAHYGAGLVETNFAKPEESRKLINGWVEKETRDKIKELIPTGVLNGLTRLVLTNAVYFKGDWQVKFDKKHTRDESFTHADGSKAKVPTMNLTSEFNYGVLKLGDLDIEEPKVLPSDPPQRLPRRPEMRVEVLEMPYAGKSLSMLVYLPETPAGINRLAALLSGADLSQPDLKPRAVAVSLPRFKAESKFSLKPVLMDMGMKSAFVNADFSPMHTSSEHLFISHVLHKAFVDVNEEGSEAAAATAVVIIREASAAKPEPIAFRADRPFVFAIRENKTGAILFLGRYNGPKA